MGGTIMKSIIFIILICLLFFSCDDPTYLLTLDVPTYNIEMDIEITGNTLYEKIECIDTWIFANIIMKTDKQVHGGPYWQTPEETIELKTGDCEDLVILFIWLCYQYLNIKPDMLILRRWGADHAISKYNNYVFADYYRWYKKKDYIYIDVYSFNKTLIYAEYVK